MTDGFQQEAENIVRRGGGGASPYTEISVTLSSADIMALHTTPKQIVPAPGAGKVAIITDILVIYFFGTTAYDVSASGFLDFGPTSDPGVFAFAPNTAIFSQSEDYIADCQGDVMQFGFGPLSGYENIPYNVRLRDDDPALPAGDGTALVFGHYMKVTLP